MQILITILAFILIFSFLIFIHELGHFTAAKKSGVKVEEFGFGLPPRLFGVKKGETIYSINWIPFGGFVRMLGEDTTDKKARKSKRSFGNQPYWKQIIIVTAGVIMNFLLAFLLLTGGFLVGMEPLIVDETDFMEQVQEGVISVEMIAEEAVPSQEEIDTMSQEEISERNPIVWLPRFTVLDAGVSTEFVQEDVLLSNGEWNLFSDQDWDLSIGDQQTLEVYREDSIDSFTFSSAPVEDSFVYLANVLEGSAAEAAGLENGDLVLNVDGLGVSSAQDVIDLTQEADEDIEYQVVREGALASPMEYVVLLDENGRAGVQVSNGVILQDNVYLGYTYFPHEITDIQKLKYGWKAPVVAVQEMWRLGSLTAVMFVNVLGDFVTGQKLPDGVAGPVGIAQMTYYTLQDGFGALVRFVAMLSLSLGVINILPLPALDGGRLLFILVTMISGKKPNPKIEQWIHSAGFVFLLLFIAYITFNDVVKLF